MEDDGFYVTLPCNASLMVYPENSISSYRTKLSTPINLKGRWQVGLCEIEYPRSWYSFNRQDGTFTLHTHSIQAAEGEKIDFTPNHDHRLLPDHLLVSKKYNINPGYYTNVQAVIQVINDVLDPAASLGHDRLTNKAFLRAKPNISLT